MQWCQPCDGVSHTNTTHVSVQAPIPASAFGYPQSTGLLKRRWSAGPKTLITATGADMLTANLTACKPPCSAVLHVQVPLMSTAPHAERSPALTLCCGAQKLPAAGRAARALLQPRPHSLGPKHTAPTRWQRSVQHARRCQRKTLRCRPEHRVRAPDCGALSCWQRGVSYAPRCQLTPDTAAGGRTGDHHQWKKN